MYKVSDSVESVLGQVEPSHYATKTDLINATALMFILISALVFVISLVIIRKCKSTHFKTK